MVVEILDLFGILLQLCSLGTNFALISESALMHLFDFDAYFTVDLESNKI